MPPETFQFTSPGKADGDIYADEEEDIEAFFQQESTKRTRKHTTVMWLPIASNISTYSECTAKIGELCPEGFSRADKPYTSKKTGVITYKFKCGYFKSHECPVFFKVTQRLKQTEDSSKTEFNLFQRGEHTHSNYVGKVFPPEVKKCYL